jgi:hypothetical protein
MSHRVVIYRAMRRRLGGQYHDLAAHEKQAMVQNLFTQPGWASLFDHVIGAYQDRWWNRKIKRSSCSSIYCKLEFGRLLNGQFGPGWCLSRQAEQEARGGDEECASTGIARDLECRGDF